MTTQRINVARALARRTLISSLLLAALGSPAFAQTSASVSVSVSAEDTRAELDTALPQHRLVGKGRLTVWGFQVYDARLWALPSFKPGNLTAQPFALELSYLRDFASRDIAERSITEMRRSADINESQAKAWTYEMQRVIPDIKKGDRVMGIHRPGAGAQLLINGKASGEIRDAEFARLFFGIWLSPQTSEPKVRLALLAGAL